MKLQHSLCPFLSAVILVLATSCSKAQQSNGDDGARGEPGSVSAAAVQIVRAFPNLTFDQPTDIQAPNDGSDRLFVVEKTGRIKVFVNDPGTTAATTFLDLRSRVTTISEMGVLGLAFHPNFAENGYFYLNYNISSGDSLYTIISRFTANEENAADVASELELMRIWQPYPNHKGGQVVFGPDGYLYIALGDGGSAGDPGNRAQNTGSLLGKILRIDVDNPENGKNYGIPDDNPFADGANGAPEIYAYGLRNPWRISFDSETGTLWAADVGQGQWEEIDHVTNGGNYGWRIREGYHCFNPNPCDSTGLIGPIFEYGRDQGQSITGGYVYHGSSAPELEGKYIYSDYGSGRVWALTYESGQTVENKLVQDMGNIGVSTFGVDADGELYLAGINNGRLYRFAGTTDVGSRSEGGEGQDLALRGIPNPSNGKAVFSYELPKRTSVLLVLVDATGREVARLVDRVQDAGTHQVPFETAALPSAAYFCRLVTGSGEATAPFTIDR